LPTEHKPCMGRPRAGLNGAAVSDYPQLSSRLPPETLARLRALAAVQGRPLWRIIVDAVQAYERQYPELAPVIDACDERARAASRDMVDVRREIGGIEAAAGLLPQKTA
jgi:predicted DNA-binding protein